MEVLQTELLGKNWTHTQDVETGHQAKKWIRDPKNARYLVTNSIWSNKNQIKIIKLHIAAHKLIAPGIQHLLLHRLPSPLWSNFLALRTVFAIYKVLLPESHPIWQKEGNKAPNNSTNFYKGHDSHCLFISWLWAVTECRIRCCTGSLDNNLERWPLLACSVKFLFFSLERLLCMCPGFRERFISLSSQVSSSVWKEYSYKPLRKPY